MFLYIGRVLGGVLGRCRNRSRCHESFVFAPSAAPGSATLTPPTQGPHWQGSEGGAGTRARALRWLANIQIRTHAEFVSREYASWWLFYLLLITCVPFTTMEVGRYGHFAPAIWLYAGHTLLIVAVGLRLILITPHLEQGEHLRERQLSAVLLIGLSVLAIALSFVHPRLALWVLVLNFAAPVLHRWRRPASVPD